MIPTINQESQAMGRVSVEVLVSNNQDLYLARAGHLPPDKVRHFQLQAFVDTGATLLVLPGDVVDRLGLPHAGEAVIRYADHRSANRVLVEDVRLELLGRQGTFLAIVEPSRTTALIGAIVLVDLDLLVDCKTNKLYPRDPDHIIAEVE
jgi:predicted aspartyl protease